jgi:hypothetical protein
MGEAAAVRTEKPTSKGRVCVFYIGMCDIVFVRRRPS